MKIKIHCRKCKDESLLTAKKAMSLQEAKAIVTSIQEVISRHHYHPDFVDVTVSENGDFVVDNAATKHYIYEALKNRMHK